MNFRRHRRLVSLLALPLIACACASEKPKDDRSEVGRLIANCHYAEAVRLAAQRHEADPDDPVREHEWRLATIALLLEQGRRASFDNRDTEALEYFRQAQELGPDVPQTERWIGSTLDKLAQRWTEAGIEWHAQDNLERAIECYEQALQYRPDVAFTREDLARALLQQNHRNGMSQTYYEDGVHSLDAYWLEEAAHDFSASLKYQETHERAKHRRGQTDAMRADDRAALALALEGAGHWAAARNEYRIATLIDKNHAESKAGRERMRREEQAANALREVQRLALRKEFDRADKALEEAASLTERQVDDVEAARQDLARARRQQKYDAARALENDFRFEEAIAAYDVLLAETAGFEDAIARRDTLQDFVSKAERHYNEALATEDPAAQLNALRQVMIVYPEYKDTRDRVDKLEAELAKDAPKEP